MDIDYEELEIVNVVQWDGEENDNAEFSMIKPDLLDQDLEESNDVSHTPAALAIVAKLLPLNQQWNMFTVECRSTTSF